MQKTNVMMLPPRVYSKILTSGGTGKLAIGESREIIPSQNGEELKMVPGAIVELMGNGGV